MDNKTLIEIKEFIMNRPEYKNVFKLEYKENIVYFNLCFLNTIMYTIYNFVIPLDLIRWFGVYKEHADEFALFLAKECEGKILFASPYYKTIYEIRNFFDLTCSLISKNNDLLDSSLFTTIYEFNRDPNWFTLPCSW